MRRALALFALSVATFTPSEARAQEEDEEYGAVATPTRLARPLREEPASVTVLRREEIAQNPTLTTDSLLRGLPSALTFRRSTSLVADPSSQGLNLRGVGPSGVSRTLVLVDGVPANDPFSGAIYWRALPRLGVERIEVVPSGSSALYGSAALAGVVQLISRPLTTSYEGEASYGSLNTLHLATRAAYRQRTLGAALEGEWLSSDGFRVVAPEQRGAVDGAADSAHGTVNAQIEGAPQQRVRIGGGLRLFRERQNGGTRYTNSDVQFALLTVGGRLTLARGSELELRLFGRLQRFEQERARIAPERVSEVLAARQDVPANDQGGSLVWRSEELTLLGEHRLAAGLDTRRVAGVSRERLFSPMVMADSLRRRDAGGEQLSLGAFVEELYAPSSYLQIDLALRADLWSNQDGSRELERESGELERNDFAGRTAVAVSPRVGVLWRPHELLGLRASGYRAFRAPTLNELYRPFQVGTVLTAPNARLGPELLTGFESGFDLGAWDALTVRATGFWNYLERPITNVTLAAPLADGSQRERQNLGSVVVRGVEASIELRLAKRFTTVLAYTLAASRVRDAGAMRELRGKELPQAPRHRASALLMFDDPKLFSGALQVRGVGAQYEDDLNTLPMQHYVVVDLSASRRIYWKVELFAAVENLLNEQYVVGRAGIHTIGQPLLVRAGLRVRDGAVEQ